MSAADASALSFWSTLGSIGFVMVILGVVLEGAELLVRLLAWVGRKRLSLVWTKIPELRVPRWSHILDHVGWLILVIGLALEFWGHIRETDIKDRELGRLIVLAGDANERAGIAQRQAAIANERTALTESNNLVLRRDVALLESEVIVLQQRTIDPAERAMFIDFLKDTPRCPVIIGSLSSEVGVEGRETARFVRQIASMFRASGYSFLKVKNYECYPRVQPEFKVAILTSDKGTSQEADSTATKFVGAFRHIGFTATRRPGGDFSCANIATNEVIVLIKPRRAWNWPPYP